MDTATNNFSEEQFLNIVNSISEFKSLEKETQLNFLKAANAMYRSGEQYIDDLVYDAAQKLFAELYNLVNSLVSLISNLSSKCQIIP